jgi:hypothetical protein
VTKAVELFQEGQNCLSVTQKDFGCIQFKVKAF